LDERCIVRRRPPLNRCPANEQYFACGNACQTTCATLNQPCLIINKKCPSGCYCKPGFARRDDGVCVHINNCPHYDSNSNEYCDLNVWKVFFVFNKKNNAEINGLTDTSTDFYAPQITSLVPHKTTLRNRKI
jgi:hypothetical protein